GARSLRTSIINWRMIHGHEPTQLYLARRRARQRTDAEIRRCLKRYAAAHLFRLMEAATPLLPGVPINDRRIKTYHPAMTTPEAHTVISVRGQSQRIVAADQASIYLNVLATGNTKRAASSDVARALAVVTAELSE